MAAYDCVILHDVDKFPEDSRNLYMCSDQPTHLISKQRYVGQDYRQYIYQNTHTTDPPPPQKKDTNTPPHCAHTQYRGVARIGRGGAGSKGCTPVGSGISNFHVTIIIIARTWGGGIPGNPKPSWIRHAFQSHIREYELTYKGSKSSRPVLVAVGIHTKTILAA